MSMSLPCIACGCVLPDAFYIESVKDNQPYAGTAFITGGHYGSTVFDPMDGSALELNICDPCLVRGGRAGRVLEKGFRRARLWRPKASEADRARAAIADTHPKDGDVKQAPLVSGGGAEGNRPNAPTPPPILRR